MRALEGSRGLLALAAVGLLAACSQVAAPDADANHRTLPPPRA
jgi:hypothetical protein